MRNHSRALACSMLFCTVLLVAPMADAAVAVYLKVDGVDGEVRTPGFEKHIWVLEWDWALERPDDDGTGANRQRGSVEVGDLTITAFNSKATPKLIEGITKGTVYARVELFLVNPATGVRIEYLELKDARVTRIETGITIDAERPVTTFSLNFQEFKYTYTEVDDRGRKQGNIETQFDITTGTAK